MVYIDSFCPKELRRVFKIYFHWFEANKQANNTWLKVLIIIVVWVLVPKNSPMKTSFPTASD